MRAGIPHVSPDANVAAGDDVGACCVVKNLKQAVCLGAVSYLALSLNSIQGVQAQSSLPAITVDPPNRIVRAATTRRAATTSPRATARRAAPAVPQVPVADRPGGFNSTAQLGAPPPSYAGGQVATGGRVGLLGNRSVFDTPFSVTNITSQHIKNTQAASLSDIIAADPSVRSHSARGSYYDQYVIRGFHILNAEVLYDGLYGIIPDNTFPAEFAERVEIFKGPNAFLNGVSLSGNIAGAINVVPKRAAEFPVTSITGSYATNSTGGTHIDYSRRYGPEKEFGVRVNGVYRGGDSVVKDNGHTIGAFAVSTDYRSDRFRATADFGRQNQRDTRTASFVMVAPASPVPAAPKADTNIAPPWTYVDNINTYGLGRAEYDLAPNLTIFGAVGGADNKFDGLTFTPTVQNASGAYNATTSYYLVNSHTISTEAGVRAKFATGPITHKVVVAGTYLDQKSQIPTLLSPAGFTGNIYQTNNPARPALTGPNTGSSSALQLSGIALTDTMYALNDRVQLTVGARHQEIAGQGFSLAGVQTAAYDKSKVTPSAGIVVKPLEKLSLYANYIEAFTRGPVAPVGSSNVGQIFAPIMSVSKEVGAKYDFGSIGMTLAFFDITQPTGITDPATRRFDIVGEQRNRGIEYTIFGELKPGLRALGGVTLLDGKLEKTAGGINDGKTAFGAPDVSLTFGLDADVPYVPGFALNGRVIYTSSQFVTADNTKQIPEWTRLDLGARYAFMFDRTPMVARFNIENVMGDDYWASSARGFLSRGAPRTFLFSLTADLNPALDAARPAIYTK